MINQLDSLLIATVMRLSLESHSVAEPNFAIAAKPNPSNGVIRINLFLPSHQSAIVNILDIRGRIIKKLGLGRGSENLFWHGDDAYGRSVPSGVYICQMKLGSTSHETKLVLPNR